MARPPLETPRHPAHCDSRMNRARTSYRPRPWTAHRDEVLWALGVLEQAAAGDGFRRINRVLAEIDVLNHALLVDDEGRALSQLVARSPDLFKANRHPKLFEDL